MKKGFCLIFFVSAIALGSEPTSEVTTFQVNGAQVRFLDIPKHRMLISEKCVPEMRPFRNLASDLKCQAARATQGKGFKGLVISGGQNPGAVICEKLKGQVTYGFDSRKNETTFCRFNDQSMISTGSLTYWRLIAR